MTRPITRAGACDEARRIITQDRNGTYGEPEDLFAAIAAAWQAIDMAAGSRDLGGLRVALYMQAFKGIRAAANPGHLDSWIDGIGYGAIGAEMAARAAIDDMARDWTDRVCGSPDPAAPKVCQTCGGAAVIWHGTSGPQFGVPFGHWGACPTCTRKGLA